jgi:AcrR family transcriptional regulator
MVVAQRLSAADWAAAALDVIGEAGIAAVAVEPLATRLGATKGSFYWHFTNRDALLEASLRLWEERHTEGTIRQVSQEADPERRLRLLFETVTRHGASERIEINILAAAEHPLVAPVAARVAARRLSYLGSLFEAVGFSAVEAGRRAMLAYTAYVGHHELAVRVPDAARPDDRGYVDAVAELLLAGSPRRGGM